MKSLSQILHWIDRGIEWLTAWTLVVAVVIMVSVSVLSIVLRWFSITYLWFDPLVRHVVFLSAFLGGVLATGRGNHIGIDILGKYLENHRKEKALRWVKVTISGVSTVTLIWLIYASWKFFQIEWQYGREVFWEIHSGFLVAIIPFGFSLIAYRFFYRFLYELFFMEAHEEKGGGFEEGLKSSFSRDQED